MELDFSIELIAYAIEKDLENDLYGAWKLQYPYMNKDNFISFEDYKNKFIAKQTTPISYEDIEKEMLKVVKAHESKVK